MKNTHLKQSKRRIALNFTLMSVLILLFLDIWLFVFRDFQKSRKHVNFYNIEKIEGENTRRLERFRKDIKFEYNREDLIMDFFLTLPFIFLFWLFLFFLTFKLVWKNLKKVEENFEEMEDFVHNAGHELKTPLAVISSNLQIAEKIWRIEDFKELNRENLVEINKINSLINWLFTLSNISWSENNKNLKNINLKFFIEKIILENSKKISEKNINLKLNLENFNFKILENHFYILFSNILFNAIRYSEKNWEINISLTSWLNGWILKISDKWIWISKENIEKIFNRFFQECRSRESENWFWIWLSLVKKISDVYGLKISVESEKWVWTKFIIRF